MWPTVGNEPNRVALGLCTRISGSVQSAKRGFTILAEGLLLWEGQWVSLRQLVLRW